VHYNLRLLSHYYDAEGNAFCKRDMTWDNNPKETNLQDGTIVLECLVLTAYSARGQLMCHEDASPDANLLKTVLVLLGHLMPQHKFCKRNFRTPAWVDNVISLHGS
jgi:hypothetical protein